MSLRTKRYGSYALLAIWMGLIFVFSAQDAAVSQGQSDVLAALLGSATGSDDQGLLSFVTRKAAHIFLYLVLGLLVYAAVRTHGLPKGKGALVSVLIALGYAVTDELHQLSIPGRSGELRDVLIDTVAAAIGIALYVAVDRHRELQESTEKGII